MLSGSFQFANCAVGQPQSCLFNGITVPHGQSVPAFQASSVPFGQTCAQEARTCSNGVLSGSFAFAACQVGQAQSCLFNGQTIAHGQSVMAFQNSSVPFGQTCQSESRLCQNGVLSGNFAFSSCAVGQAQSCLFNGQTVAHGQSVTAFLTSSVPFGQTCTQEARTCVNGALSGSYQFGSCSAGQPQSCLFNGQTIAHGQAVTAYGSSSVPFGQTCSGESRLCNNGVLSGSFQFSACAPGQPASCLFNGQTIAHGQAVTAFQAATVPAGQLCQPETRLCNNGNLSGSFAFSSCQVQAPPPQPVPLCLAGSAQSPVFNHTPYVSGQSGLFFYSYLGAPSCPQPFPLNCDQGVWRHPNGMPFVSPYGPIHLPYEGCSEFSIPGFGSAG